MTGTPVFEPLTGFPGIGLDIISPRKVQPDLIPGAPLSILKGTPGLHL
jgi:hypothetical protein